jgi:hypothetical protein
MVEVTYHCPYCGAVTGVEREGYLDDNCVTREPLEGWTYAGTTDDFAAADGSEFVCLGAGEDASEAATGGADDPDPDTDGCGRTFYLSFCRYEDGRAVDHRTPK